MTEIDNMVKSDTSIGMDVMYRARIKEENPNQLRIIAPFLDSAIRNRANKSFASSKEAIRIREGSYSNQEVMLNPSSAEAASS